MEKEIEEKYLISKEDMKKYFNNGEIYERDFIKYCRLKGKKICYNNLQIFTEK